jgi:hypothetical protein
MSASMDRNLLVKGLITVSYGVSRLFVVRWMRRSMKRMALALGENAKVGRIGTCHFLEIQLKLP